MKRLFNRESKILVKPITNNLNGMKNNIDHLCDCLLIRGAWKNHTMRNKLLLLKLKNLKSIELIIL